MSEIARRANQLPRALRRRGGYLLSLLPALFSFQPLAVKVQTLRQGPSGGLDTRHDGPAMVVAFANTPTYGGGILIAPQAKLDDGKLEICVVGSHGESAPAAALSVRIFRSPRGPARGQVFCGRQVKNRNRKTVRGIRRRRVCLPDAGRSHGGACGVESDRVTAARWVKKGGREVRPLLKRPLLARSQIHHVDVCPQPRVVSQVPSHMVRIVIDHDVVAVPQPVGAGIVIVGRSLEEKSADIEAVSIAAMQPPDMLAVRAFR